MAKLNPEAVEELKQYARSRQRGAGRTAGRLFQIAAKLTSWRIASLPKLTGTNPEIRWLDVNEMTIYFRVVPPPITVVKIERTTTQHQRDKCEADARKRSKT